MADSTDEGKKGSGMGFVIALVLVALVGAGGGAGFSEFVLKETGKHPEVAHATGTASKKGGGDAHADGAKAQGESKAEKNAVVSKARVATLEPIHVTLAGEPRANLRLDASVLLEGDESSDQSVLRAQIAQDFIVYLKTVPLAQIDSAAGLEFVREDLAEIARMRGGERTRDVVLRAVMIE